MRILAIDIGSSSVKAGLWTGKNFLTRTRIPFKTHFNGPITEVPAKNILHAVLRAGEESCKSAQQKIDAIAFCTFSPGILVADAAGNPLTPVITHADRRSVATAGDLLSHHPKKWWLARTGNLPYPGSIGTSTLAHLRRHQPALFKKNYRIGQLSTLITWLFAGKNAAAPWLIDPSQAAFLGLYDIRHHTWNADVCRTIHISPESLPKIRSADTILGTLSKAIARRWDIPAYTPVLGGFVDTSAAVLQTPMRHGQLAHNAGSTDVLAMCVNTPAPAEGILTRPLGVGCVFPERWLSVRTIAAAGSALTWAHNTFYKDLKDTAWQRLLNTLCHRAAASDNPVLCQPTFAGDRAAMTQPTGAAFSSLRLGTTRENLLTALIRGLIAESARSYTLLAQSTAPRKEVFTMGGASALGDAMHAAWPNQHHIFHTLTGDGLRGLVLLAQHTLQKTSVSSQHP